MVQLTPNSPQPYLMRIVASHFRVLFTIITSTSSATLCHSRTAAPDDFALMYNVLHIINQNQTEA